LKSDNNSGVGGLLHFDARPWKPMTVTGYVTGLSEG